MEYPTSRKRASKATSGAAEEDGDFIQLRIIRERRSKSEELIRQKSILEESPTVQTTETSIEVCSATQKRLFVAVDNGNVKQVLQLVEDISKTGNIIKLRDPTTDKNVLHYAASNEKYDIVKALVTHCDQDLLLSHHLLQLSGLQGKNTALHILTEKNNIAMVQYLLNQVEKPHMLLMLQMETVIEIQDQRPRLVPCLHLAAYYGYTDMVKLYLDYGIDVNVLSGMNDTALLWASRWGHNDTVDLLLDRGANVEVSNDQGLTALYWAIRYEHVETVNVLLDKGKANPNTQRSVGLVAPIILASSYGLDEIVRALLEHPLTDMNVRIRGGERAIHHAATEGHLGVIEQLVRKGADVNDQNDQGDTPLLLAVENGHNDIVQFFLKHGAYLNHRNQAGRDAWHFAMESHNTALVKTLVAACRKIGSKYRQPLCIAAGTGKCDKVQFLLNMNIDPMSADSEGNTFLHHAAMNNKYEIIKKFHTTISVNVQNQKLNTPLHVACLKGHTETITALLNCKANSDIKNEKDETALHAAAYSADISAESVKQLVEYTLKTHSLESLNERDLQGNNCLHIAGKYANPKVMWEFRYVRLNDKDKDGFTPLHHAVRLKEPEALDMMLRIFENTNRDANLNDQSYVTRETILHLAVDECHSKSVKRLIDFGADISLQDIVGDTVLHRLTRASVEDRARVGRCMKVMDVILENIVKWWCMKRNIPTPESDNQEEIVIYQRKATLYVVHEICNNERLSVLDQAIKVGAIEVVSRLLMLPDVTMFEDHEDSSYIFDLTHLTSRTCDSGQGCWGSPRVKSDTAERCSKKHSIEHSSPRLSGVEWIVTHTPREQVAHILDLPPIRMIEQYYTSMVARTFILLMLLHIAYMSVFTYVGVSVLSKLRNDSSPINFSDAETILVYAFVPIEPLLIVVYVVYIFIRYITGRDFGKVSRKSKRRGFSILVNIAASYSFIVSCFIFAALVIAWICLFSTGNSHQDYLLAPAVCIGWLSTIAFTRGIRMIHYFYRMLISMILRDVVRFLIVYLFVIIAFGFAFHVLFQVSKDVVNDLSTPGDTLFQIFNMMIGMDEIFTDEFEANMSSAGRSTIYIKVFYIIYIILATVVLLNLLIAMMNDSYQRIQINNRVIWRIESIGLGIEMESYFPVTKLFTNIKLVNKNAQLGIPYDIQKERWYVTVPAWKYREFMTQIEKQSSSQDAVSKRIEELEQRNAEIMQKLNIEKQSSSQDALSKRLEELEKRQAEMETQMVHKLNYITELLESKKGKDRKRDIETTKM